MQDIWDIFREEEDKRLEQERVLIAAELAAYNALPQSEKDRITAEREIKLAAFAADVDECTDDDGDDDAGEDCDEDEA